jgi:predicted amidohydrolase
MNKKQLRIGAIQIDCQPCQVQSNLALAASLIRKAAGQEAQLILLPELAPGGYRLTEEIWDCAEPIDGPIVNWFTSLACDLGIYLGAPSWRLREKIFTTRLSWLRLPASWQAGCASRRRLRWKPFSTALGMDPISSKRSLGGLAWGFVMKICYMRA